MTATISDMEALARKARGLVISMCHKARAAHLGSALSCLDILVAAYFSALRLDPANPGDPARDRFILSKGHAAPALYAVLALRGFFPLADLDSYATPGSPLEEHPAPGSAPGVEAATGSLGHGLPIGAGLALGAKIAGRPTRSLVVVSDGECNEGSVWEAAMFASGKKLDNLLCVVDFNRWQATGRSCEVLGLEPLREKWAAFGWSAMEVDGHDMKALVDALGRFPDGSLGGSGKPVAIVAHTVKGKGVSFMEDDNNWHYRVPKAAEVERAHRELGLS